MSETMARPDGWEWTHEREARLIERDGWMCEQHPGLPFEHDPSCAGPGMPWMIEGRAAISDLVSEQWAEEREAAAKKCEAIAARLQRPEAATQCARAIRSTPEPPR